MRRKVTREHSTVLQFGPENRRKLLKLPQTHLLCRRDLTEYWRDGVRASLSILPDPSGAYSNSAGSFRNRAYRSAW